MLKIDELEQADSCFHKAHMRERIFVLLARDLAAPGAIREWARLRCLYGKNSPYDEQIKEALECADLMEEEAAQFPHTHSFHCIDASGRCMITGEV